MIRHYKFTYGVYEAECSFTVDMDKFKIEDAKELLAFFDWSYDKEGDPYNELMKKYAMQAIKVATAEEYNEYGVQKWFAEQEGFLPIDGSQGVTLTMLSAYEWDEGSLEMNISFDGE